MTIPTQPQPPSAPAAEAVTPRPAATILLLRDGSGGGGGGGVEVFMVVRHREIDFASGALVFPGGRVEEGDFAVAARPGLCAGLDGLDPTAAAFRVAAIRETFEECGILLARPQGAGADAPLVSGERLLAIDAGSRAALCRNEIALADLLAAEGLTLAADRLAHYAHWITPALRPKRYDTHFFLAEAPPDQVGAHDGWESVDSMWIDPRHALAETAAGRFTLVFATRLNLERLARAGSVAAAFAQARNEPVVTVVPEEILTETGRIMRIPAEAGYGGSEFDAIDPPAM